MSKLYLDDVRPAPAGWVLARSVDEAIYSAGMLTVPWEVSLDFDLGMTAEHCETCNDSGFGYIHNSKHPNYCPDCSHLITSFDQAAPTGIEFLYRIIDRHDNMDWILPDKIYLHTANPIGRSAMQWVIRDMEKKYDRQWPEAFR